MTEQINKEKILGWVELEEDEFNIESLRRKHNVDPESSTLKVTLSRLTDDGVIKRLRRGWYRKVKQIEPIKWWDGVEGERIPLIWPYGIEDGSSFDFDSSIEVFPGDSIVIAGDSNWGKTTFALNLLVNNLGLFAGTTLMVNEFKPQRFRARMKRFTWVNFWDDDKPKFELLPITENHPDYIRPNNHNLIDWLHIKGEFWDIASIIEQLQMQLRDGIVIVVLQKTTGKKLGVGGDWGKFFPAVYLTIDAPGTLTVVKVKSAPSGGVNPQGKMFAFDIIEGGSQFHNIREVKTCGTCKGRGYNFDRPCGTCNKKGYINK